MTWPLAAWLTAGLAGGAALLGDFEEGWDRHWAERKLARRATRYSVVEEDGNRVLLAESETSASGLWRKVRPRMTPGAVSWRWKVEPGSAANPGERTKRGDDYAARVFVVFEPTTQRGELALCYVWALHEPAGSLYDSPFTASVKTLVLRSGRGRAGDWVKEERDVAADFVRAFGGDPGAISAVAIMTDTDNTRGSARAFFDDLVLRR